MAKETKKAFNENAIIKQISLVGIIGNIILCAFKMLQVSSESRGPWFPMRSIRFPMFLPHLLPF